MILIGTIDTYISTLYPYISVQDLGEIMTWWGIYGICAPALSVPLAVAALASPLFVTFLITKVSGIPLLEISNEEKYKNNESYQEFKRNVPVMIPTPTSIKNYLFPSTSSSTSTSDKKTK